MYKSIDTDRLHIRFNNVLSKMIFGIPHFVDSGIGAETLAQHLGIVRLKTF